MSKPIQIGDASPLESLDAAYKASQEHHERERLLALRLAHQGNQTLEQIGVILKRGRATIARWLKAYRKVGYSGYCIVFTVAAKPGCPIQIRKR